MKFEMAKNSLFAILLRSPWWASAGIALAIGVVAAALLPEAYRVIGALSGLPFAVISAMAAWRQRQLPSAARIEQTQQAVAAMAWPAFANLLEQAFRRDGYAVQRGPGQPVDFVLERQGRRLLVSARRWKSAHTSLEALRALQSAREAHDDMPTDALCIGLGQLTDSARPFAAAHRITVWQVAEVAQALRGLTLGAGPAAGAKG
jgi:restriction system protein